VDALVGAGVHARLVPLDVTDATSVRAAAEKIAAEHGRLDVWSTTPASTSSSPSATPAK
jgi:NAD(P)-dependent dehydrogenase (short-subunit alcohol dehydrogenase family)